MEADHAVPLEAGQLPNRTEAAYDEAGQLPNRTEAAYDEAGRLPNRTEAAYDEAGQLPNRTEAAYDEAGQLPNRTEAAKRRGRRNRCRPQRRWEDSAKRGVRKTEEADRLREKAIDREKCERTTTKAVTQNKNQSASPLYSGNYEEEQHGQGNQHPFTVGTAMKNNMDKGINTPLHRELRGRTTRTRESSPLYSGNYEEEQHGQGNHHR